VKTVRTDRSRIIQFQRCPRSRWLGYHQDSTGLSSATTPLPLAVGSSVHEGLAELLRLASASPDYNPAIPATTVHPTELSIENSAVLVALTDFSQYKRAIELPTAETAETTIEPADEAERARMAEEFPDLVKRYADAKEQFQDYLYLEQASLVEAMVRAYARRRLRPLLEQYEVLEVEREGEWVLSDYVADDLAHENGADGMGQLLFMSRPDALLLYRESRQLVLLSFKTVSTWDIRRQRDAEHDMQGLSEGVEVERRLAEWHSALQHGLPTPEQLSPAMDKYLSECTDAPRILAVRYEFLQKGDRWRDKDLSAKLGFEARSQRSPLVRGYLNSGMTAGDEQWNVSWDFLKPDGSGETSKLYWKNWRSSPVWEHMRIADWITRLDESAMAMSADADASGQDVRELGYHSPAQATGYLKTHPLDDVFLPPVMVYRNEDDLRDLVEQIESQERRVAEAVELVNITTDEGERRSLLNQHFPQARHSCEWPSTCGFVRVCYGGEEIRRNPLASGLYRNRVPNHPQEQSG
jgi:hypothetical protein